MPNGFDIPREQLEAGWESYEDQLNKCAQGEHPKDQIQSSWDYYGDPQVPGGTVTFQTHQCGFCHAEWAS